MKQNKKNNQPIVSEFTLIFAFRYALGRMSTAPSYVATDLKNNWHLLSKFQKEHIKEDIEEAIKLQKAGMACDVETWNEILKLKID